jgi:PAS domain S-box-containing protein
VETIMPTPLRVLILEDEPADAELMAQELRRAGFDPEWERVATETEYLALLDPALDLILADYRLPQFDGLLALRFLQERGLDIPFILVSGTIGEELAVSAMKQGATDYLLKDRLARLGQAVAHALEQRRLRSEGKQAEERLRLQDSALKAAANAIVITDRDGRITSVNPAFTRLTGYTAQEAIGETPRLLRSGKHDQAFYRTLWETILSGQAWSGEVINRRKDGSLYTEEQTITPVHDERGAISHFISIKQDITERKRVEETLQPLYQASLQIQAPLGLQERLDRLLHTAQTVLELDRVNVLLSDPEERMLEAVASLGTEEPLEVIRVPIGPEGGGLAQAYRTQQMVVWDGKGRVPEELRLKPPYDQIEAFRSRVFANVPLVAAGRSIGVMGADRKRSSRPLEAGTLSLLQLFAAQTTVAIQNAQLFEQVLAGRGQLQVLSRRLVEVQEAERRHLARELHDEIGQLLSGLKLVLETGTTVPSKKFAMSLDQARKLVNELMVRVRNLSLDLRPAMLDDLGLLPALLWNFERYTAQFKVHVVSNHSGLERRRFPPHVETGAYRIVQEALTNVARHAGVSSVTVRLWTDQEALHVQVEDKGTGFDPKAVLGGGASSGLTGMRERALLLGGHLVIDSIPGSGTQLTAQLPLRHRLERRKSKR